MAEPFGQRLVDILPRLMRYARSLSGASDLAEDLVQTTCERALAASDRFQEGTRFDAWTFRILRNAWIDKVRKWKTEGPTDDIDQRGDLTGMDGRAITEQILTLHEVEQAMLLLSEGQREIMLLICVEEFSYKEAAELLDVPIGTVMSRLARARLKLAEKMGLDPGSDNGAR